MTTEERLEKLEVEVARQKRYNRGLIAALAAKAVGVVLLAAAAMVVAYLWPSKDIAEDIFEEVRAQRFVLVDETGNNRILMAVGENGSRIVVLDENGEPTAGLIVDENGSELLQISAAGESLEAY